MSRDEAEEIAGYCGFHAASPQRKRFTLRLRRALAARDAEVERLEIQCDALARNEAAAKVENERLKALVVLPTNEGSTHWDGCYTAYRHHECALREIARLRAALEEIGDTYGRTDEIYEMARAALDGKEKA